MRRRSRVFLLRILYKELLKIFAIKVPKRKIVTKGFKVEGQTNKPNTTIAIAFAIPKVPNGVVSQKVQTDATGKFVVDFAESTIPENRFTKYAWYGNASTSFIQPTDLNIILPGKQEIIPIYVVTGWFTGDVDIHGSNIGGHIIVKDWVKVDNDLFDWFPFSAAQKQNRSVSNFVYSEE